MPALKLNTSAAALRLTVLLCGLAAASAATAQTPPDAGSLLQQNEARKPPALPPAGRSLARPAEPMALPAGTQVFVKAFVLRGNTLIDDAALQAELAPFTGRRLGLAELQAATARVGERYSKGGWLVRCYLPPQDLTDGVIQLQIIEARFGGVRLEGSSRRFDSERARRMIEAQQPVGAPLRLPQLDRALMLLDDLPGFSAKGSLVPGAAEGETGLALSLADTPLLLGEASADNAGSRSTGAGRANLSLALNSPLGLGEQAGLSLSHSQGSDFARLFAGLPVGDAGWKIGANLSTLRYRLIGRDFAALQARGSSQTVGLDASLPLLRGRSRNLLLQISGERKRFDNQANGGTSSRYDSSALSLNVSGNLFDELGGGGANTAALGYTAGSLDLSGSPSFAADALSTRSHGNFGKLRYAASRQQALTGDWSAALSLAGQWSADNLDSSEKFYLGGPFGVRAYPVSEAGGSSGQLVNAELRSSLPLGLRLAAFYDWGQVQINGRPGFVGAPPRNRYALQGAGLSLGWTGLQKLELRATVARRIGSNPNASAAGTDQDGSLRRNRLWLQASLPL